MINTGVLDEVLRKYPSLLNLARNPSTFDTTLEGAIEYFYRELIVKNYHRICAERERAGCKSTENLPA